MSNAKTRPLRESLEQIKSIILKAGEEVLKIYERDFEIEYKDDKSPLTEADKKANNIICRELQRLYPDIPVLSEENKQVDYQIRKNWQKFWLIDPLDGTKEFIKKNGEFTINIALIEKGEPVLGVVYAPVLKTVYYAKKNEGAYKIVFGEQSLVVSKEKLPIKQNKKEMVVVASKSHLNDETKNFIENLKKSLMTNDSALTTKSKGSSLKICMVAEGIADIYPRLGPTMEWDTAAADAVVREAGKMTYIYDKDFKIEGLKAIGNPLQYNKENLLNPYFVVTRRQTTDDGKRRGPIDYSLSTNIIWHFHKITKEDRSKLLNQKPVILWFTGLSGSGKSTIAGRVEEELYKRGNLTYLLDGDNIRHGLNKDLGFGKEDRKENIRRIGEVAKLFVDAGFIVLTAFISPFRKDREFVRSLMEKDEFIEIFIDAPFEECIKRDPKGLYKKALNGEIKNFTGIDSEYEQPLNPEIYINTVELTIEEAAKKIIEYLKKEGYIYDRRQTTDDRR